MTLASMTMARRIDRTRMAGVPRRIVYNRQVAHRHGGGDVGADNIHHVGGFFYAGVRHEIFIL